ncbi:ferredoxin [Anianabacter salinae]|uniref:ferredoxin n=1 Tax=Anianabacter salinae TaxID=2851023 RepID=UPI00225E212E|nr:ferredoxin [Anianabacter salinae]MBV0913113.1 ferredoxin [Anianabacter salinae]
MTRLAEIDAAASEWSLSVLGALHAEPKDGVDGATIVLLGPREPGFWDRFTGSDEYGDGLPDPLDRWSRRVVTALADRIGARAEFPFGGPPFRPFIDWALRSGAAWQSPVGLLVHRSAGLMVSYRGALVLQGALDLGAPARAPCDTCAGQPCRAACPAGALTPSGYDVPLCKAHVRSPEGEACRGGCLVRRACPVSQAYGRRAEQSAFHMRAFAG